MAKSWVILGAGHFIDDILDAIHARDDEAICLVLNQKLPEDVVAPSWLSFMTIESFVPYKTDSYIFGFINPNKQPFIDKITSLKNAGKFENLIHPAAYISHSATLGYGNYLGPNCVIGPKVKLGNFNYINRCANIGHGVEMGSFNHLGPGAVVCGRCQIKDRNFLGANSTLIDGTQVACNTTLGAGAVATKNLVSSGTYVGVPAKRL